MLKMFSTLIGLSLFVAPAFDASDCRSSEPEINSALNQIETTFVALSPFVEMPTIKNVSQCSFVYGNDEYCFSRIMVEVGEARFVAHGITVVLPRHIVEFNTGHCEG